MLRTEPSAHVADKVCYKRVTFPPPIKSQRKPFFFFYDLWPHSQTLISLLSLHGPVSIEDRVGESWRLTVKKLCESEQESGTSVPRLISGFVFFKQTLTNLLKIPTEPSSQPALTRLSVRHTSSGLANSQHQSNIKASGCRWRGRCVLKNPHFLINIKKQAKSLPLKQSWTRLLWVI